MRRACGFWALRRTVTALTVAGGSVSWRMCPTASSPGPVGKTRVVGPCARPRVKAVMGMAIGAAAITRPTSERNVPHFVARFALAVPRRMAWALLLCGRTVRAGRGRRCVLLVADVRRYDLLVADPGAMAAGAGSDVGASYGLSGIGRPAAEDRRLGLLEEIFDPVSRRRRSGVQAGWRCLEVGAGRGSMAVWLAERVGPRGGVVATRRGHGRLDGLQDELGRGIGLRHERRVRRRHFHDRGV